MAKMGSSKEFPFSLFTLYTPLDCLLNVSRILINDHKPRSFFQNEKTRTEIQQLDEQRNYKKLSKLLLNRLSFGTAGLRGCMQGGYNAMNDLVVIQTAQGMVKYIKKCFPSADALARGIVFGYDGRYNSKR